ncbi:hypothetical protein TPASS_0573 [Treponema pallidum subsp. pallidum SS14]|uniref:Uncharacterized protein TP_0573 n=2 Tax=Treponema pallidum subsp. pallidum TaxID=161 RepID=Y573_TREPA|nr:RecName: Full=Uncharacterized protein TP_0573 [Treponema pallidum subsp. pallidum str. Nichols]AAC65550.1 predicted coding region TP0573 [Treponema pallidum subsp. pallidum str. Nichols]ACD70994.1 hypothetical protein TPASS_0573 [Treponema pallidum subsp. pallidum SS14]
MQTFSLLVAYKIFTDGTETKRVHASKAKHA